MFHTSIDLDGEHLWAQRPTIDLLPVKGNKKKIFSLHILEINLNFFIHGNILNVFYNNFKCVLFDIHQSITYLNTNLITCRVHSDVLGSAYLDRYKWQSV